MPKLAPNAAPSYRLHRQSGQAIVTLSGKDHLLGPHGTTASKAAYDRLVAEWISGGRQLVKAANADLTIAELLVAFWHHAEQYYRNHDGTPAGELDNFHCALRPLKDLYARTAVREFGPLALKAVRQSFVASGACRTYVNRQIARVKQLFKWGTENELVPASIYHALATVSGLRHGKGEVRESKPVRPAPAAYIEAIKPFVSPQVRTMIELQLLTGMRGGEIFIMRTCDVDTGGTVWKYRPSTHKTAHHAIERVIDLGGRCQDVLRRWLRPDEPETFLFSPKDAEAARNALRREKLTVSRLPPDAPPPVPAEAITRDRAPGDHYDRHTYRRAIARACEKAFPPPPPLGKAADETRKQWRGRLTDEQRQELRRWNEDHSWHPHQLRHSFATNIRKEYGLESARVLLGHKSGCITAIYAEQDRSVSETIMREVG